MPEIKYFIFIYSIYTVYMLLKFNILSGTAKLVGERFWIFEKIENPDKEKQQISNSSHKFLVEKLVKSFRLKGIWKKLRNF